MSHSSWDARGLRGQRLKIYMQIKSYRSQRRRSHFHVKATSPWACAWVLTRSVTGARRALLHLQSRIVDTINVASTSSCTGYKLPPKLREYTPSWKLTVPSRTPETICRELARQLAQFSYVLHSCIIHALSVFSSVYVYASNEKRRIAATKEETVAIANNLPPPSTRRYYRNFNPSGEIFKISRYRPSSDA